MEISEAIELVTGQLAPPTSAVQHRGAKGRRVDVIVRNSRRNGQPARLIVRYVNGAPSEGLPSHDKDL